MEKDRLLNELLLNELRDKLEKAGAFDLSNIKAKDIFYFGFGKKIAIPTRRMCFGDLDKNSYTFKIGEEISKTYHCQFIPIGIGCHEWLCFVFEANTPINDYLIILRAYQVGLEYVDNEINRRKICNEALTTAAINVAIPPSAIYSR